MPSCIYCGHTYGCPASQAPCILVCPSIHTQRKRKKAGKMFYLYSGSNLIWNSVLIAIHIFASIYILDTTTEGMHAGLRPSPSWGAEWLRPICCHSSLISNIMSSNATVTKGTVNTLGRRQMSWSNKTARHFLTNKTYIKTNITQHLRESLCSSQSLSVWPPSDNLAKNSVSQWSAGLNEKCLLYFMPFGVLS